MAQTTKAKQSHTHTTPYHRSVIYLNGIFFAFNRFQSRFDVIASKTNVKERQIEPISGYIGEWRQYDDDERKKTTNNSVNEVAEQILFGRFSYFYFFLARFSSLSLSDKAHGVQRTEK